MTEPAESIWRCATCGAEHAGLATVFGPAAPEPWTAASDSERAAGEINADLCLLSRGDGTEQHFIRGEIRLPVLDSTTDLFVWSAWVSLSARNMALTIDNWGRPERVGLPPMFAWLCSALPYEPSTLSRPAQIHTRPPGEAPSIELDPSIDHPLVREQVGGITLHRVATLNDQLLRG
jgi:hypothetical protein